MKVINNGKNPNDLHDFLIANDCSPISLNHNAVYNSDGIKTQEATEIYIEAATENATLLETLVNQFMTQ